MYFFSNSPVKWRLTKVVCRATMSALLSLQVGWLVCLSCSWAPCAAKSFLNTMCQIWTHLSCSTVTDKHELEGGNGACFGHGCELLWWWGMCVM